MHLNFGKIPLPSSFLCTHSFKMCLWIFKIYSLCEIYLCFHNCHHFSPHTIHIRASNEYSRWFHNHGGGPYSRAFSWLKVPNRSFTFKTLLTLSCRWVDISTWTPPPQGCLYLGPSPSVLDNSFLLNPYKPATTSNNEKALLMYINVKIGEHYWWLISPAAAKCWFCVREQ